MSVKRKVTVPVGRFFKSGLPRASWAASNQRRRSAVTAPLPWRVCRIREDVTWEVLRGFQLLGEWTLDSEGTIKINSKAPLEPGVYAFVVDNVVRYVGFTNDGLQKRLYQYQIGHRGQKTNARVKALIKESLANSRVVKVFVATPELGEWNDLPV
jgi:hypothetical protein